MAKCRRAAFLAVVGMGLPFVTQAQDSGIRGLHGVLDQLYQEMMPLCSQLIGVGQGIAGFAATWYIASRVWKHIANAEPIDFYPLFRPFVIGFCILIFPSVIGLINGIMQPTVTGTAAMVDNSDRAIRVMLERKEQAVKESKYWQMYVGDNGLYGDREKWLKYTQGLPEDGPAYEEGFWESIGNDFAFAGAKMSYNFRNSVKEFLAEVLRILFEAAALCINTLRTFQLIVLAILGPLVFGLAVFDGFQHTLTVWLARYINIFLWLPVANIFGAIIGKIQEKMLEMDLSQIDSTGDTFFTATDTGYLIFMIIGIIGYFTVPSVANYIVHAASGGALPHKVSSMFSGGTMKTVAMAGTGAGMVMKGAGMVSDSFGNQAGSMQQPMSSHGTNSGYFPEGDSYRANQLKGNS